MPQPLLGNGRHQSHHHQTRGLFTVLSTCSPEVMFSTKFALSGIGEQRRLLTVPVKSRSVRTDALKSSAGTKLAPGVPEPLSVPRKSGVIPFATSPFVVAGNSWSMALAEKGQRAGCLTSWRGLIACLVRVRVPLYVAHPVGSNMAARILQK